MTPAESDASLREQLLHLLSISATLCGLCIGGITFLRSFPAVHITGTVVDDLLAACALAFLVCIYLSFWALRTRRSSVLRRLTRLVDWIFVIALTIVVGAGFLMVYTVL